MNKGRLEAFSDGVIAIIVTIMVLELRPPHEATAHALLPLLPKFLTYLLSFAIVAIMWVNHHYIMHGVKSVDNRLLWANNLMLFCMSLIPFFTAYVGEHYQAPLPVAAYGISMVSCGLSFTIFRFSAARHYPEEDRIVKLHYKDMISSVLYLAAIPLAYASVYISFAIFAWVAVWYFIPRRI